MTLPYNDSIQSENPNHQVRVFQFVNNIWCGSTPNASPGEKLSSASGTEADD